MQIFQTFKFSKVSKDVLAIIELFEGNVYANIVFFVHGASKLLNCVNISEQYVTKSAEFMYGINALTGILSSSWRQTITRDPKHSQ